MNEKFKIVEIGLFGSYSAGMHHLESDIDILYHVEEGNQLGIKAISELEEFMKGILKIDKLDLINRKYLNPIIELEIADSLIYV